MARGLEIVLLPAAYHRGGAGTRADAGQRALLRPGRRDVPGARRRAARVGGRPHGVSASASPSTACARCRPTGSRRSPQYADRHGPRPPCARLRAAARARRVRRRARLLADRAARALRLPRPAHERRPRDPRRAIATSSCWPPAARSSSPARPPRATSATATCPGCATATRACGWRSAPTRRCGSIRSRSCARSRRCARREGQTRFALLAAADGDLWGQTVANGRASLGLEGPAPRSSSTSTALSSRVWPRRTSRSRSPPAPRPASCPRRRR